MAWYLEDNVGMAPTLSLDWMGNEREQSLKQQARFILQPKFLFLAALPKVSAERRERMMAQEFPSKSGCRLGSSRRAQIYSSVQKTTKQTNKTTTKHILWSKGCKSFISNREFSLKNVWLVLFLTLVFLTACVLQGD